MQIIPPKVDWKTKYVGKYFKEKYKSKWNQEVLIFQLF